jgi:NADPH:quinone reductase-like Zn-dependent oxidoreductase
MSVPKTMRAVLLTGHGGLDKLDYRDDVPVPVPGHGEALIRVAACGMNNTDINTRTAWYSEPVTAGVSEGGAAGFAAIEAAGGSWGRDALRFPLIQGCDIVGRVAAVGPGVPQSRLGERVMVDPWLHDESAPDDLAKATYLGSECDGGFAEYVKVRSQNVYPVRSALSDPELASMPCAFVTGEHQMVRARVAAGETVVVTGASGGVGSAVIQLAKNRGAFVIAVTSAAKRAAVAALGADAVVTRDAGDLAAAIRSAAPDGKVHVACDVVGGTLFPSLIRALAPGGRYVSSGAIAGPLAEIDLRLLVYRDLELYGSTVVKPGTFARVLAYIQASAVRPLLARTFPLREIRAAQTAFLEKDFIGNFVLVP